MTLESGGLGPGWYYAEGDPPGTQRYWDGNLWVGGPQPIQMAPGVASTPIANPELQFGEPAGYLSRVAGFLVDISFYVVLIVVANVVDFRDPLGGLLWLGALVLGLLNIVVLQGITGQSIGKKLVGTRLVKVQTGQPVGIGFAFLRILVASFAGAFTCNLYSLIDYLFPAFDSRKQRITDKMLGLTVLSGAGGPSDAQAAWIS